MFSKNQDSFHSIAEIKSNEKELPFCCTFSRAKSSKTCERTNYPQKICQTRQNMLYYNMAGMILKKNQTKPKTQIKSTAKQQLYFFLSSNSPWDLLYLHVFFSHFSIWIIISSFGLIYFELFMLNACIVFYLVDFTLSKLIKSILNSDLMFKTKDKTKS